jgi:hypothetical protein
MDTVAQLVLCAQHELVVSVNLGQGNELSNTIRKRAIQHSTNKKKQYMIYWVMKGAIV